MVTGAKFLFASTNFLECDKIARVLNITTRLLVNQHGVVCVGLITGHTLYLFVCIFPRPMSPRLKPHPPPKHPSEHSVTGAIVFTYSNLKVYPCKWFSKQCQASHRATTHCVAHCTGGRLTTLWRTTECSPLSSPLHLSALFYCACPT